MTAAVLQRGPDSTDPETESRKYYKVNSGNKYLKLNRIMQSGLNG